MIRDRGRIKWTAMMLPEHLTKLRDWVGEDEYEEKPDIDEWTLQEFQQQLDIAHQSGCEIRVKTWEDGVFIDRAGILKTVNERSKLIYLEDGPALQTISLSTIIKIETIDFTEY